MASACRARSGGLPTQLVFALGHAGAHLVAAVLAATLLELGVETCIRCAPLLCSEDCTPVML